MLAGIVGRRIRPFAFWWRPIGWPGAPIIAEGWRMTEIGPLVRLAHGPLEVGSRIASAQIRRALASVTALRIRFLRALGLWVFATL